ncbi:MAG: MATE family efflux transporter [Pseudomonadota bacterium]
MSTTTASAADSRAVWRIAGPLILSNLTVPLLGMVDAAVLGHLERAGYLAGVSLAGAVFSLLFISMNFLRMGTTGLAAQADGRRDGAALREILGQGLVVAVGIAVLLIALQRPVSTLAWQLLGAEPAVQSAAATYFDIRIWGAPLTLANYVLLGWFIGLQNARAPLIIVLIANSTNIVLDIVFVNVVGMRADGVALASVIAEGLGLATGLFLAAGVLSTRPAAFDLACLKRAARYARFFALNRHIFVRTLVLVGTLSFMTAQGVRFGEVVLAANALLMNLQAVLSYGLDGLAQAAEALVGHAWGERRVRRLRQAVRVSLIWSVAMAIGFAAVFWGGGPFIIGLLTDLPDVRAAALTFLPWLILSPLVSVWSFLFDGVFVGTTWGQEMRDVMLVSSLLVFVPAWWLSYGLGNHGLWLAFTVFMLARGLGMAVIYGRRMRQPPVTDWPEDDSVQSPPQ